MVNLKKYFKAAVSSALALSMALAAVPITASASDTITFLEGDVNDDGYVTISDVALIAKYLNGKSGASSEEITRMDAVQNKVIEMQDYNKILLFVYKGDDPATPEKPDLPKTVTSEVYTNIDDSTRAYFVYNFESDTQVGSYTLAANTTSTASTYARTLEAYDDYHDNENINTVQLDLNGNIGSGFIVGEHLVATAAHCVYGSDGFGGYQYCPDIEINILNAEGTAVLKNCEAVTAHVPELFVSYIKSSNYGYAYNYDYALLYVEEDLLEYGIWSLGCMTTEFMATGDDVIASGFTGGSAEKPYNRYYSCGPIVNFNQSQTTIDNKDLRFNAQAMMHGGKSGGPVYYETTYNGETVKSVIGIAVGMGVEPYYDVWGTRITPTLLRFFLNNSYIEYYL